MSWYRPSCLSGSMPGNGSRRDGFASAVQVKSFSGWCFMREAKQIRLTCKANCLTFRSSSESSRYPSNMVSFREGPSRPWNWLLSGMTTLHESEVSAQTCRIRANEGERTLIKPCRCRARSSSGNSIVPIDGKRVIYIGKREVCVIDVVNGEAACRHIDTHRRPPISEESGIKYDRAIVDS
jgi:hypothetical protein